MYYPIEAKIYLVLLVQDALPLQISNFREGFFCIKQLGHVQVNS